MFTQIPTTGEESNYHIHSIQILPDGVIWLLTLHEGDIRVSYETGDENQSSKWFLLRPETYRRIMLKLFFMIVYHRSGCSRRMVYIDIYRKITTLYL
ncbi:MAG: hypothetical protein LIP01_03580, partial [Tannerellaceae bacterium]|nr:hypothetical protein [Tannerellaceae bacterium]